MEWKRKRERERERGREMVEQRDESVKLPDLDAIDLLSMVGNSVI